jgi:putative DNA primase/helicase
MSDHETDMKARLVALQKQQAWALKSEDARRINAMIELARSEPGIAIKPEDLDRDPWLFNCSNGTLDLRSGKLREHRRDDLLTKLCPTPYEPEATCPLWEKTLSTIFAENASLVDYLRRLCGYCLTGTTGEQILPIFWGEGSNGKSLVFEVVRFVLGTEYVGVGANELLGSGNGNYEPHPTYLADLFGRRLVTLAETREGGRLNEAQIKKLTGGDRIKARGMREDFWEFTPTHKIWLATNHKPDVRGTDHGIWRRLRLLPFTVRFWDPDKRETGPEHLRADKGLPDKLKAEASGILAWMVRGCLEWQAGGLNEPEEVQIATSEYRGEQDVIAAFIRDRCQVDPEYECRAGDLYAAYRQWHEASGESGKPMSGRRFGEELPKKGYPKKTSNGRWYEGIQVVPTQPEIPWGDDP